MGSPLDGTRVIDFTRVLAGPHCTKVLRDLGAEVLKVEPPGIGDLTRYPPPGPLGCSHYFTQQNAGKKAVCVDLNFAEGRALVRELCRSADVVVENFRPGTLRHFELDYERVSQDNPRVIYASISGFGQGTSMSHRGAFAPTVHAEMGMLRTLMDHYGDEVESPKSDAFSHADVYTGLEAAIGVLAALQHRHATGKGQHVDVAMAATMLSVNERAHVDLNEPEMDGEPVALGATEAPILRFHDGGWIVIPVSPVLTLTFHRLAAVMRRNDLLRDPRFATAKLRRENIAELMQEIQSWVLTFQSFEDFEVQMTEAGLAAGRVRSMAEFSHSEWAEEWGATTSIIDAEGKEIEVPGFPWRFSDCALEPARFVAELGEHNAEVFAIEDIERLEAAGIVSTRRRARS